MSLIEVFSAFPQRYRWEKDGEDVDLSKYPLRGGNLYLAKPSYREEGIYRCFAHNQYGVAISSKIEFVMACTYMVLNL